MVTIIMEQSLQKFKNLEFLMVEDYKRKTNQKAVFSMRFPRLVHSDEDGLCFDMHMPGMDSRHVSVCVEDNTLVCEGTRPDGKLAVYLREFDDLPPNKKYTRPAGIQPETQFCAGTGTYIGWMSLPKKMYTQTDVQATMKEGVLRVTFPNLTKEDLEQV
nr:hypothetical protein [Tanacetum cinerariifolium]